MFAEYSSKWCTCNPLEKPKPAEPAAAPPQTKPQNLFAPSSEKPTSSSVPSPFDTGVRRSAASDSVDTGASKNDYHKLLTEFYQKHNAQKMAEVTKTLEKYKVRRVVTTKSILFFILSILFVPIIPKIGKRARNVCQISTKIQNI